MLARAAAQFGVCSTASECNCSMQDWTWTVQELIFGREQQTNAARFTFSGVCVKEDVAKWYEWDHGYSKCELLALNWSSCGPDLVFHWAWRVPSTVPQCAQFSCATTRREVCVLIIFFTSKLAENRCLGSTAKIRWNIRPSNAKAGNRILGAGVENQLISLAESRNAYGEHTLLPTRAMFSVSFADWTKSRGS